MSYAQGKRKGFQKKALLFQTSHMPKTILRIWRNCTLLKSSYFTSFDTTNEVPTVLKQLGRTKPDFPSEMLSPTQLCHSSDYFKAKAEKAGLHREVLERGPCPSNSTTEPSHT